MASGLRGYSLAQELRHFGWRTILLPKQIELSQRQRLVRLEHPHVVVLQKSRHPLNRPKYFPGSTCVFDIDDADFVNPNFHDSVIECIRESAGVIAGSHFVAEYARQFNSRVWVVWTGSRPTNRPPARKLNPPVVAWAISDVDLYPNEFAFVLSALNSVKTNNWQFWLFGVADAEKLQNRLTSFARRGIPCRMFPFMPYQDFLRTLDMVSIGLAPLVPSKSEFSQGKSFGKVLGYLNSRAAIVASDSADHPKFFKDSLNGFLASNPHEFAERIERLLSDENLRKLITERAYHDYVAQLSISAVAKRMDSLLRSFLFR
jgi:hypothetical protein